MNAKAILILFVVVNCFVSCLSRAALRRTPKVYNALITTDENLTSSRAYPVIQPTIHETGISHYPFGHYSGYGFYSPPLVRFGQPIAPGLVPREQLPYPLPHNQFPPQLMPHFPPHMPGQPGFPGYPPPQNPPTAPSKEVNELGETPAATENAQPDSQKPEVLDADEQQPVVPPKYAPTEPQDPKYMPMAATGPQEMPNEKLPILLNEYGLPPSLIPLQQYPINRNGNPNTRANPVNLPPYAFNQYPLLPGFYDPITGFREQYLPPYEYSASPHQTYAIASAAAAKKPNQGVPNIPHIPVPPVTAAIEPQVNEEPVNPNREMTHPEVVPPGTEAPLDGVIAPNFDSIKNASKNKNSEVPDVPPPPIPSGAKTKPSS